MRPPEHEFRASLQRCKNEQPCSSTSSNSKAVASTRSTSSAVVTWTEVALHNSEASSWTVFEKKAYDITEFIDTHPGGEIIRLAAGRDCTPLVTSYHTRKSLALVRKALATKCKCLGVVRDENEVDVNDSTPQISPRNSETSDGDSDDPDVQPVRHSVASTLRQRPTAAPTTDESNVQSNKRAKGASTLPSNTKYEQSPTDGIAFWEDLQDRVDAFMRENNLSVSGNEALSFLESFLTMAIYLACLWYRATHVNYYVAIFTGIMMGRMGFLMHSGNHCSQSRKTWANRFAGLQMSMVGSSDIVWSYEHQVAHHLSPNEVGKDNDCEIGKPWLRFHPDIKREWWHRYQHIVTMAAISVGLIKWFFADFLHFIHRRSGNVRFNPTTWNTVVFLFFKAVWVFLNIVLPWKLIGFGSTIGQLLVSLAVGAHYMEQVFIVNHTQRGLVPHHHGSASGEEMHWAKKQILGTANWASGSMFWTWVSGGLNHQIEHHIFPAMSVYNYPRIAHIVKATCEDHNIPYHNYKSFVAAHRAMIAYLKDLGRYDDVS